MKLYTHVSEEFANIANHWAENLRNEEPQMHTYLEELAEYAEYLCNFAIANEDLMEDERDSWFASEDFSKSKDMENLMVDAKEILKLIYKINWKIGRVSERLEGLEVEYSEDLDKLYTEEHKYDYERA